VQLIADSTQIIENVASNFSKTGSKVTSVKDQLRDLWLWLRTLNQAAAYRDRSTLDSALVVARPSAARVRAALEAARAATDDMQQRLAAAHEARSRVLALGGQLQQAAETVPNESAEFRSHADAAMSGIQTFGVLAEVAVEACSKAVIDGGQVLQLIREAITMWVG